MNHTRRVAKKAVAQGFAKVTADADIEQLVDENVKLTMQWKQIRSKLWHTDSLPPETKPKLAETVFKPLKPIKYEWVQSAWLRPR